MGEVGWEKSISTVGFGSDVIVACRCLSHNAILNPSLSGPAITHTAKNASCHAPDIIADEAPNSSSQKTLNGDTRSKRSTVSWAQDSRVFC